MLTKVRYGFRGKKQRPLFMIWKEYWEDNKIIHARVVFVIHSFKEISFS